MSRALFPLTPRVGVDPIADEALTLGVTLSIAGTVLGAYHGYRRNDSVGWAIGWALLGGAFPLITVPVALAQGFGEKA